MNDCVFNYICCCECTTYGKCVRYISMNDDKGRDIERNYESKIRPLITKVLKPIRDEISKKYNLK